MSSFRVSSESSENILPLPWILVGAGVVILGLLIMSCVVYRIRRKSKSLFVVRRIKIKGSCYVTNLTL